MHGMSQKVALLESPLLPRVAGLHYTFCNVTKNELLTKFLEGAFKLTEKFQEVISTLKSINLQTSKLQLSALRVFKIFEITPTAEFLSSEAGAKQQPKPPMKAYKCT